VSLRYLWSALLFACAVNVMWNKTSQFIDVLTCHWQGERAARAARRKTWREPYKPSIFEIAAKPNHATSLMPPIPYKRRASSGKAIPQHTLIGAHACIHTRIHASKPILGPLSTTLPPSAVCQEVGPLVAPSVLLLCPPPLVRVVGRHQSHKNIATHTHTHTTTTK
jgi:hypothetical protein